MEENDDSKASSRRAPKKRPREDRREEEKSHISGRGNSSKNRGEEPMPTKISPTGMIADPKSTSNLSGAHQIPAKDPRRPDASGSRYSSTVAHNQHVQGTDGSGLGLAHTAAHTQSIQSLQGFAQQRELTMSALHQDQLRGGASSSFRPRFPLYHPPTRGLLSRHHLPSNQLSQPPGRVDLSSYLSMGQYSVDTLLANGVPPDEILRAAAASRQTLIPTDVPGVAQLTSSRDLDLVVQSRLDQPLAQASLQSFPLRGNALADGTDHQDPLPQNPSEDFQRYQAFVTGVRASASNEPAGDQKLPASNAHDPYSRFSVAMQKMEASAASRKPESMEKGARYKQLYLPDDENLLSDYQILLRKQIEAFEATDDDVKFTESKLTRSVAHGQVGIRCRHCAALPQYERPSASMYFPRSLEAVYQFGQNMVKNHLIRTCRAIPPETVLTLTQLQQERRRGRGGRERWSKGMEEIGVYEADGGILRFRDSEAVTT